MAMESTENKLVEHYAWVLVKVDGTPSIVDKAAEEIRKLELDSPLSLCVVRADEVKGDPPYNIMVPMVARNPKPKKQNDPNALTEAKNKILAVKVNGKEVVKDVKSLEVTKFHPKKSEGNACDDGLVPAGNNAWG